ncbi:hypothetical protein ABC795_12025 [Blastococcus sp. HT6-30]|uniref:hypothetical protein n=1 Tax=Blastococcus sp. HT6-30 TaxID=3144843 RepID=UPI00321BF64B
MKPPFVRLIAALALALALMLANPAVSAGCGLDRCPTTGLNDGAAAVGWQEGAAVGALVSGGGDRQVRYAWRIRTLCMISDETRGACTAADFRECPQQPGRVIGYYVIQARPVVYEDADGNLAVAEGSLPTDARIGDLVGDWNTDRQGCIDITPLNPPPSPGEVFSYFQRLPLPELTTRHQPPGDGLTGLPVIFYTDSPTTQTFTVGIRGFTVVIEATAEQFTWHTGDAAGSITTTDPGAPYPDQTIEHSYRSGTYTASLTVTWGATFSVDGSAEADVPGTTTTSGPPVTFDVLQARTVLTNPYD